MNENIESFVKNIVTNLRDYTIGNRTQFKQRVSEFDDGHIDGIFTAINNYEHAKLSDAEVKSVAKLVLCLSTIHHEHMYHTYFEHPKDYIRKLVDHLAEEVKEPLYRGSRNEYWTRFEKAQVIDLGNKPYSLVRAEAEEFAHRAPVQGSVFIVRGDKRAVSLVEENVYGEVEFRLKRGTQGVIARKWKDDNGLHYYEIDVIGEKDNPGLTGTANTGQQ